MSLIDFILNLAGLLLWLNWLALRFDPLARTSPTSLVGTLRKADPTGPKRWKFLVGLAALLFIRTFIYWEIGPAVNWTPSLQLGAIAISFRIYFPGLVLVFSVLSFLLTLAVFYLWLLLLSVANSKVQEPDPLLKLVRLHFGWIDRWPRSVRLLLPLLAGALVWLALEPLLSRLLIVPQAKTTAQLMEQAGVIGLGAYLSWKYLIAGALLLHLLHSYVYLGKHPFWIFLDTTARNLLAPLRWVPLQLGKVDFAPLVAIALVFLIAEFSARWLTALYMRLPL